MRRKCEEVVLGHNPKIWFHGTTKENAELILKDGFKARTYFAAHLEDAIGYGGLFVFDVVLPFDQSDLDHWQVQMTEPVPVNFITRLTEYSVTIHMDMAQLRTAVFEAALKRSKCP